MSRRQPLFLIFQWHMHQPFYRDAVSGQHLLPWVRLHCTKDYTDMAWHLERFPDVKGVVNFVPSLLTQIRAYTDFVSVDGFRHRHIIIPDNYQTKRRTNYEDLIRFSGSDSVFNGRRPG